MAWQEVTPDVSAGSVGKPSVKVRGSAAGSLYVTLHHSISDELGWRKGTTLALLVGGGNDAEGKIALKPKVGAPLKVDTGKVTGGHGNGAVYSKVHVGRFARLNAPEDRKSVVVAHETRNDQLIVTLPDGWLRVAA